MSFYIYHHLVYAMMFTLFLVMEALFMESPFVIAMLVFFGIFLMFFLISLLSDLFVIGIMISSAIFAYFIPEFYDSPNFQQFLTENLRFMRMLGISFPEQLDAATHYLLGGMIMLAGTLACVPVLPFSAVYRQMLGANKISRSDELHVRTLVAEELELIRQRVAAERFKQQEKALKRKRQHSSTEEEPNDTPLEMVTHHHASILPKIKATLRHYLALLRARKTGDNA
jgi:hypothetical protein